MLINEKDLRSLIKKIIKEAKGEKFEKDDEGNYVSKKTAMEGITKEIPADLIRTSYLMYINHIIKDLCDKYKVKLGDEELINLPIYMESEIFNFFKTREGEMCINFYINWKKKGNKEDYLLYVKKIEKLAKVERLDAGKEKEKKEGMYNLVWDIIHYFVHKASLEDKKSSKD
jgi:hypothetical protein